MIKDYIAPLTFLTLLAIFNNIHADTDPYSIHDPYIHDPYIHDPYINHATPAPLTPSLFQKNAGVAIPILETAEKTYITNKETDDLNYGLHLINGTSVIPTTPQIQFLTDYVRSSCNPNTPESNMPECSNSTGIYTTIRASNIFNSINYTDPADPVLNASIGVIRSLVEPFPDPQLNTLLKDTANFSKNESNIAGLIAGQVPVTMAKNSLNGILARRYVDPATTSKLPSDYNSSSIMQIMHDESLRRLTDSTWFTGLNNLPLSQLVMELLEVEAFKLWMEYNKFQQNERIEALLATLVSAQASQANAISGMMDPNTKASMRNASSQVQQLQNNVPSQYTTPPVPTTPQ